MPLTNVITFLLLMIAIYFTLDEAKIYTGTSFFCRGYILKTSPQDFPKIEFLEMIKKMIKKKSVIGNHTVYFFMCHHHSILSIKNVKNKSNFLNISSLME